MLNTIKKINNELTHTRGFLNNPEWLNEFEAETGEEVERAIMKNDNTAEYEAGKIAGLNFAKDKLEEARAEKIEQVKKADDEILIHVFYSDNEDGYMYDIYKDSGDFENGESFDGGLCTSTMENALDMAYSQTPIANAIEKNTNEKLKEYKLRKTEYDRQIAKMDGNDNLSHEETENLGVYIGKAELLEELIEELEA